MKLNVDFPFGAMEFSIRQRLLTWQLICCPLFLLARKHNQSSLNRETNLLSPPLTNSRNFDTSRRWTPNQTIDRSNERKRERGYAGQVWLSVDIMTGSVFIIFDVGWGGGLLLFLCVWRVAEQTHTHIAMWTSMTVVSQIIGKKKRYLPRDSDGLVVGLLLRTCSSSSAKGLEGKEEKSCCCCCCRHTHTERVKKRKKYIGQSIVGGKSRPRWVGISYTTTPALTPPPPATARARNRKEKKTHPLPSFFPFKKLLLLLLCVYVILRQGGNTRRGIFLLQEFAKKAPKAGKKKRRNNNNGYKITL